MLLYQQQPVPARGVLEEALSCFERAGDLDGSAQTLYEFARLEHDKGGPSYSADQMLRRAMAIAQISGHAEQEIMTGALLSELLLDSGDEEAAYIVFSRSMQTAGRYALPLFEGRLLSARADYYFRKGDYLQAASLNSLAASVTKAAGMSRTYARCLMRDAEASLRMQVPAQALIGLSLAEAALGDFVDPVLRAQIGTLRMRARESGSRPEGSIYSLSPAATFNAPSSAVRD
jgi:tetratricopeptide (TPR) repeat protein